MHPSLKLCDLCCCEEGDELTNSTKITAHVRFRPTRGRLISLGLRGIPAVLVEDAAECWCASVATRRDKTHTLNCLRACFAAVGEHVHQIKHAVDGGGAAEDAGLDRIDAWPLALAARLHFLAGGHVRDKFLFQNSSTKAPLSTCSLFLLRRECASCRAGGVLIAI